MIGRVFLIVLILPLVTSCSRHPVWAANGPLGGATTAPQAAAPQGDPSSRAVLGQVVAPQALDYFVGSWLATATNPTTGDTFTLKYRVEPMLGGTWITGLGESAELGFKARDVWGVDPMTGEIIRVIFDGSGTYATVRAHGWQGDMLVLEGEARQKAGVVRVRETIRRVGPNEFRAIWEALRQGSWRSYSVERLVRQ